MKKFSFLLIVLASFTFSNIIASTPLTKVSFYEAYQFSEMVQYAEKQGKVDGKIAFYLMDENNDLGERAAVINALGWNEQSKANADTYKMFLGRKYGVAYESLELNNLTGDELLCLGYLVVMDENKDLSEALGVLELAIQKNTQSYITNMIYALASAQIRLNDKQECDAWTLCNSIRTDASFKKDISDQAIGLIYQEVDVYKSACN